MGEFQVIISSRLKLPHSQWERSIVGTFVNHLDGYQHFVKTAALVAVLEHSTRERTVDLYVAGQLGQTDPILLIRYSVEPGGNHVVEFFPHRVVRAAGVQSYCYVEVPNGS